MSLLGKNKKKENIKKSKVKDKQVKQDFEHVEEVEDNPNPRPVFSFKEETEVAQKLNGVHSDTEDTSEENKPVDIEEKIKQLESDVIKERDKALRLLAEYDNYRRRTQSEYRHIIQQASERLILNILPVVDDFNRFFEQNFTGTDPGNILDGVELIYRKLMDVLTTEGLKPIDTLGQEFSAELHEAVAQIEDSEKPDGVVILEVEKGFQLGDKIIRHPKVVVNKKSEYEIEAQDE